MFEPKKGCPLCSIVASGLTTSSNSPSSANSTDPEVQILHRDENFTAYREKVNPVSTKGHIIIAFNLHVPSLYTLSSADLPLLVNVRNLATRLLTALDTTESSTPSSSTQSFSTQLEKNPRFRIGFITPPFKDNKIPVTDHLHAHAYIEPSCVGWWRGLAYGSLAWYAIDDLIAEIRESVSNNRVKSGYENRQNAPIDKVAQAGARSGTADGREMTNPGLTQTEHDLEEGTRSLPRTPSMLTAHHPLRT